MKAQVTLFSSQDEAAAEALALSQNGWQTVMTGPLERTRILQDEHYVASYAGSWLVLASRSPLHSPS